MSFIQTLFAPQDVVSAVPDNGIAALQSSSDAAPAGPQRHHDAQTTLLLLSTATSRSLIPSHDCKTSSVFAPSNGDGFTSGGLPSLRTGQAGILKVPLLGC
ncbi:MAG: hypothetical protein ACM31O_07285 [Bacteroidota bacterium]